MSCDIIRKMSKGKHRPGVFEPADRRVWPHERRTAEALAKAGYYVEFLPESNSSSPDAILDGSTIYEMKSPRSPKTNSMEQLIKDALYNKKCPNIIFDSQRIKNATDEKVCNFLVGQVKSRKAIKGMLFVNKHREVIDIFTLI